MIVAVLLIVILVIAILFNNFGCTKRSHHDSPVHTHKISALRTSDVSPTFPPHYAAITSAFYNITAKLTPRGFYDAFMREDVLSYVNAHVFVNCVITKHGDVADILLRGHEYTPYYPEAVPFRLIVCESVDPDTKLSPCIPPYNISKKIFYKKAKNLQDYIRRLHDGRIMKSQHSKLFSYVFALYADNKVIYNHNESVAYLHFRDVDSE